MEFTAKLNYVRVSPQKARLVLEPDQGPPGGRGAGHAAVQQEGHRAQAVQAAALGGRERELSSARKRVWTSMSTGCT